MNLFYKEIKYVFGGFHKNEDVRFRSTSGGAFSAIVDVFCDSNYVIFGASSDGLNVEHSFVTDKRYLERFRKSKYSQSKMGTSFVEVMNFLKDGKKVLFSGTPCQISGLRQYLNIKKVNTEHLLTVEVVCEGVPSPLYMRKYDAFLQKKYGGSIEEIDYRYTGRSILKNGKWDFEVMKTKIEGDNKVITKDRWFNPFWSIWLNHLMSRPSCYECQFAKKERTADITLGDLWGVHLYCPELYGKNGGSSIIFANTEKGKNLVLKATDLMYGHELRAEDALRYQTPMRRHINVNPNREAFMKDLQSNLSYDEINKKWVKKPTFKLLWQKYIWGNRQKIWLWNFTNGKYKIV